MRDQDIIHSTRFKDDIIRRLSMRTGFSGLKFLSIIAKNKKFIVEDLNKFATDIKSDLETERKTDRLTDS